MNTKYYLIVISFVIAIFDTYISFSFFNGFLQKRQIERKRFNALVCFIWILTSVMSILARQSVVLIISILCINLFISFLFYESEIYIKLFSTLLFICLGILTEAITFFLLNTLNGTDSKILEGGLISQIEGGIISKILLLILVKIICVFRTAKVGDMSVRLQIMLLFMPASSIIIVYKISRNAVQTQVFDLILTTISVIGILYINMITFILFEVLMRQAEERLKYELAKHQLDCQVNHYKELKESRDNTLSIWHDMKNHLFCIETLASEGRCDEISRYISKLGSVTQQMYKTIDTGNPVIDALIEGKRNNANESGIKTEMDISLPEQIPIEPIDICIVLGNALDNAIEANNRIKDSNIEKEIKLKLGYNGDYLLINIANASEDGLALKRGKYYTSKENKRIHGFGLRNIKTVVDKYNGNMKLKYENKKFTLNIIMLTSVDEFFK